MTTLDRLRAAGWVVAVHNDYRLDDKSMTFWLFAHPSGVWAKGEGPTDEAALAQAERQAANRLKWAQSDELCPVCRGTGRGPIVQTQTGLASTPCGRCAGKGRVDRQSSQE